VELRGPPHLRTPIPPSNSQILNTHKEIFIRIKFILILEVWWFNNPALVELRGPLRLKILIPPWNFQILNTYKEDLIKNATGLILDVGWFEVGTYLKR
jgi:hypothetical protein